MALFRRTPSIPVALSLDIGTEFVKTLVFEVHEDHGVVIGAAKHRQRLSDMQGGHVTDIHGVISTAAKAIEEAFTQAGREAEQTVVGIAGELVKGATTSTTLTRRNPNTDRKSTRLNSSH